MKKRSLIPGSRIASFVFSVPFIQGILAVVLILTITYQIPLQSPVTAAAACGTSGPSTGLYTVTVCITNPAVQSTLTGNISVTAFTSINPAPAPGSGNPVQKLVYTLDGNYLLTDFQTPYDFLLPTRQWVDGSHTLSVQAVMRDGFTSSAVSIAVSFVNGVSSAPTPPNNFSISPGTSPARAGDPLVVAAVGDGAAGETNSGKVVSLISSWKPNLFLYLGDVYEAGSPTEFTNWYGHNGLFFDTLRSITNPTVGNHEYFNNNGQAPGYMNYWGSPPHNYSFNAGGWHFISIDSNLENASTAAGSAAYQWLQNDLAANQSACTLAYWHIPLYNVGKEPAGINMSDIWALLVQNKADLVLTGHDHDYQRWVPLDGSGTPSSSGLTEFVVGTGGHGIQTFVTSDIRLAKGFDSTTSPMPFGALQLKLYSSQANYQFINTAGNVLDSGTITCKNAGKVPAPTPIPKVTPTPISPKGPGLKFFLPLIDR